VNIYEKYEEFKSANPEKRISFSKFKILNRLKNKQDSSRKAYQKILNRKLYYQHKNEELRSKIRELKATHKKEISGLKREKSRPVKWRRIIRVSRPKCVGCKKYERLIEKPLDTTSVRTANLMKTIVGLKTLNHKLNETDILLLTVLRLAEYLTLKDAISWTGLQKTTVFNSLSILKNNDYVDVSGVKSLTGKKDLYKYYITLKGEEELKKILNIISRATIKI